VDQDRHNGGIDAARQPADHPAGAAMRRQNSNTKDSRTNVVFLS
jgi:hypothetical protein